MPGPSLLMLSAGASKGATASGRDFESGEVADWSGEATFGLGFESLAEAKVARSFFAIPTPAAKRMPTLNFRCPGSEANRKAEKIDTCCPKCPFQSPPRKTRALPWQGPVDLPWKRRWRAPVTLRIVPILAPFPHDATTLQVKQAEGIAYQLAHRSCRVTPTGIIKKRRRHPPSLRRVAPRGQLVAERHGVGSTHRQAYSHSASVGNR